MSETKSDDSSSAIIAIILTAVGGIIVFLIAKWFLSFIIRHWVWTVLVVLAAIGFGLYQLLVDQS